MGLWTKDHVNTIFPTFAIMILIALLMRPLLLKKSYEIRMIPIKIISILLVLAEVGKQVYSISIGYNFFHFPLQFCSMFVFILPVFAFYRGKWQSEVGSIACAAMIVLLFGMLIVPNVIYNASAIQNFFTDFLSFHTVFFHMAVMFALFLSLALDLHLPKGNRRELLFITGFEVVFSALAASASQIFQENYSSFLYPSVEFLVDVVENIKLAIGALQGTILYTVLLAILHVLIMILSNYVYFGLCMARGRIKPPMAVLIKE